MVSANTKSKDMKTLKRVLMQLVEVEFIPSLEAMELGKFYYSQVYKTASHLCPCGCGTAWPIPIRDGEWSLNVDGGLTISPSLAHRINCQAHYVILNGEARILRDGLPRESWYPEKHCAQPGE
jgi:hypothetical protein